MAAYLVGRSAGAHRSTHERFNHERAAHETVAGRGGDGHVAAGAADAFGASGRATGAARTVPSSCASITHISSGHVSVRWAPSAVRRAQRRPSTTSYRGGRERSNCATRRATEAWPRRARVSVGCRRHLPRRPSRYRPGKTEFACHAPATTLRHEGQVTSAGSRGVISASRPRLRSARAAVDDRVGLDSPRRVGVLAQHRAHSVRRAPTIIVPRAVADEHRAIGPPDVEGAGSRPRRPSVRLLVRHLTRVETGVDELGQAVAFEEVLMERPRPVRVGEQPDAQAAVPERA